MTWSRFSTERRHVSAARARAPAPARASVRAIRPSRAATRASVPCNRCTPRRHSCTSTQRRLRSRLERLTPSTRLYRQARAQNRRDGRPATAAVQAAKKEFAPAGTTAPAGPAAPAADPLAELTRILTKDDAPTVHVDFQAQLNAITLANLPTAAWPRRAPPPPSLFRRSAAARPAASRQDRARRFPRIRGRPPTEEERACRPFCQRRLAPVASHGRVRRRPPT